MLFGTRIKLVICLLAAVGLAGCVSFGGGSGATVQTSNPWAAQQPYEWPPYQQSYADDLELGPAQRALLAEADAHYEGGRYESSAAAIERALRFSPRSPVLWYRLASLRASQADYSGANRLAEKARSLSNNDATLRVNTWLRWLNDWLVERLRSSTHIQVDGVSA